ncbi:hypothetical protein NE237_001082 [Protea cynaroides]|uniref:Uncharacterized protein n=1 Tax=Protea cynaroides TaxID=273540 RepID=A0A9Q0KTB5_9MAGN|nr:hypothetical protein NE237_001082 [Protea cynaroides]
MQGVASKETNYPTTTFMFPFTSLLTRHRLRIYATTIAPTMDIKSSDRYGALCEIQQKFSLVLISVRKTCSKQLHWQLSLLTAFAASDPIVAVFGRACISNDCTILSYLLIQYFVSRPKKASNDACQRARLGML